VKCTDESDIVVSNHEDSPSIIIPVTSNSPAKEPIVLAPTIKPIRWWQIWRWHLISERNSEIGKCMNKFDEIYGELGIDHDKFHKTIWKYLDKGGDLRLYMKQPLYDHDMPECTFLGNTIWRDEIYDLYYCEDGTFVVRDKLLTPFYSCGLKMAEEYLGNDPNYLISVAYRVAKELNLIKHGR